MLRKFKKLKHEMRQAAMRAYSIGLQSGDGGNLSIRIPGEQLILIKASGVSFGELSDMNIVLINFQGEVIEGKKLPSREYLTHVEIYSQRDDINAVFHSHSPWATALSLKSAILPPLSLPLEMKLGKIPVLDAGVHQADRDVAEGVSVLLNKHPGISGFIQKRHGLFALATKIVQAEHNAELIEDSAHIAVLHSIMEKNPEYE